MSKHVAPISEPLRMDQHRFATNGQLPSPVTFRRLADGFNHVIGYRPKVLLCRCADISDVPVGSSFAVQIWPLYFRTGDAQDTVVFYVGLALSDGGFGTPYFLSETFVAATESSLGQSSLPFNGQSAGSSVSLDEIAHGRIVVGGLTPNTEYFTHFAGVGGVRPVYLQAVIGLGRNLDDAVPPVCNPSSAQSEAPILDADISKLVGASNGTWRHNGSHLFAWTADYDVTDAPATVSTSYTDLLTGTADTRKFFIPAQYQTTLMRTTVPVALAVKANRISGAGNCDVRLYDGTNSIAVTGIDDSQTEGWYTATGTIPAADTSTWQIQAKHDSGSVYEIQAVYLYPWEA